MRTGHIAALLLAAHVAPLSAQQVQRLPLAPIPPKGEPVAPFFEGWYRNDDGTFTLSFGFFNLNTEQILEIPLGPDNFIEPGEFDGMQPTHFPVRPRRDRGVFSVTVPAHYGDGEQRLVWTITANGVTYSVPGRVGVSALQLDYGPRAMGSVPPMVRFDPEGPAGQHVQGVWGEPRTAKVGEPLTLQLWTDEVSDRDPEDLVNQEVDVEVSWFKHLGPAAEVSFEPWQITIAGGTGEATTAAVFSEPGEYVLRARVDNWNANDSTGGDQCCWTNAYVRVTVTT
ncbi:hypothetical protein [Candidatus Palauibacter sp.]|uniref:hypothetical protein n=1 Tax=Candidatus Palauibacter sp. TaxID=3101350 RepID=UPI003AF25517